MSEKSLGQGLSSTAIVHLPKSGETMAAMLDPSLLKRWFHSWL